MSSEMSDLEGSVEAACLPDRDVVTRWCLGCFLHTQVLDSAAQEYNCYSFMMKAFQLWNRIFLLFMENSRHYLRKMETLQF